MKEKAENILPWRPIGLLQSFSSPRHRNAFAELKPTGSLHHCCCRNSPIAVGPEHLHVLGPDLRNSPSSSYSKEGSGCLCCWVGFPLKAPHSAKSPSTSVSSQ